MKKFLIPMAIAMGVTLAGLFLMMSGLVPDTIGTRLVALVAVLGGLGVQFLLEDRGAE